MISNKIIFNLDFDLPCKTSPGRRSRGTPGGRVFKKLLKQNRNRIIPM